MKPQVPDDDDAVVVVGHELVVVDEDVGDGRRVLVQNLEARHVVEIQRRRRRRRRTQCDAQVPEDDEPELAASDDDVTE